MSLIIIVYNVVAPSFAPGDEAPVFHMYKCKAKEGLLSKSSPNTEHFLVPTISLGYQGAVTSKDAMGWFVCAFFNGLTFAEEYQEQMRELLLGDIL